MPTWFLHPRLARSLRWVVLGLAIGCNATPLPEPPALDPGKIGPAPRTGIVATTLPGPVKIAGTPGAASGAAFVRLTNLDTTAPTVMTTAGDDGSFALTVFASPGNELRLEAVSPDARRSEPMDFIAVTDDMLAQSERFPCLTISPGLELAFAAPGASAVTLANGCAAALSVADARERLALVDFTLSSPLPLSIAPGTSAELAIQFTPSADGAREDVLFVSVGDGSQTLRYPFTFYRP